MEVIQEKGSNEKENEVYFNFINSIKSDVTKEIYGYLNKGRPIAQRLKDSRLAFV
jgi:hypothetical protein